MQPDRIAALLAPFLDQTRDGSRSAPSREQGLTTSDLASISTYIDLLLRWNARINLTAIRDPEEIVTRHFGESLFAARLLFPPRVHVGADALVRPAEQSSAASTVLDAASGSDPDRGRAALQRRVSPEEGKGAFAPEAQTLADLGSGAGFPGLPIKLWTPDMNLTLIESNQKKATFLREVVRALTLTSVNILNARAQDLIERPAEGLVDNQPGSSRSFDVVTLRAVERFEAILPVAATLVAPEGRLALLIGSTQLELAVAALPMLSWGNPVPIPLSRSRVVAIAHRKPLTLPG